MELGLGLGLRPHAESLSQAYLRRGPRALCLCRGRAPGRARLHGGLRMQSREKRAESSRARVVRESSREHVCMRIGKSERLDDMKVED